MELEKDNLITVISNKVKELEEKKKSFDRIDYKINEYNNSENSELAFLCHKCKGKGLIAYRSNNDLAFKKCSCYNRLNSFKKLKRLGLSHVVKDAGDIKDLPESEEWEKKTKRIILEYLNNHNYEYSIYLGGQSGSGKTTKGTQIIKYLISETIEENKVLTFEYFSWDTRWRELVFDNDKYALIKALQETDILFLDDFFRHTNLKISDAEKEVAKQVLDWRYTNKMQTIITSELYLKEIIQLDEALGSRIKEMCDYNKYVINIARDSSRNYRLKIDNSLI